LKPHRDSWEIDLTMPRRPTLLAALVLIAVSGWAVAAEPAPPPAGMIDLTNARRFEPLARDGADHRSSGDFWRICSQKVGASHPSLSETVLMEESWDWPGADRPVVAVGLRRTLRESQNPLSGRLADTPESHRPEGFEILIDPAIPAVVVAGNDARGVRFGLGRLLRELRFENGRMLLPSGFHAVAAPRQSLRGHQLGYRPKTNAYDAWDKSIWWSYIRDLSVFGANAIEVLPPRTDDAADSPHFPSPPLEMMAYQAIIADHFDMDVWIWFPVMDPVDTSPSKAEPLLKEWDVVFRKLKRLDAVFVPGGDPGHIAPKPLFAFLERAKEVLHRSHPKAQMWVSPQGFDAARVEEFLTLVKTEPKWLDGVVFGPQVRVPLAELRKALPAKLPIRGYPDITHSRQCQHPVPD
jgi:hypothetical protein